MSSETWKELFGECPGELMPEGMSFEEGSIDDPSAIELEIERRVDNA